MKNTLFSKYSKKKGFTLIELLIVIAILAILALLGLPRLASYLTDSRIQEVKATGVVIGRAGEAILASDLTVSGVVDAATAGPYLKGDTATRVETEYILTVSSEGVLVEYIGTVVLVDTIVYDSRID